MKIRFVGGGTLVCLALLIFQVAHSQTLDWDELWDCDWQDIGYAIAVDDCLNVYVAGSCYHSTPGTHSDMFTVKYESDGTFVWEAHYDGSHDWDLDVANAIALWDSADYVFVYVTGKSWVDSSGNYDYTTIRYEYDGTENWVSAYNGPGDDTDNAVDIRVDRRGDSYITGRSKGIGTDYDWATIKYNSLGVEQWVHRGDGGQSEADSAYAITISDSGYVYVTGSMQRSAGGDQDIGTIKLNNSGVYQWGKGYDGDAHGHDQGYDIEVDRKGNVFVTGQSDSAGTTGTDYRDYITIMYNAGGTEQWASRYAPFPDSLDVARAIAIGDSAVYVTGYSTDGDLRRDYATVKYNYSGVQQWASRYEYSPASSSRAYDLKLDSDENVYVTGTSYGDNSTGDITTVCYNSEGDEEWVERWDGPNENHDYGRKLALWEEDEGETLIHVTGTSYVATGDFDAVILKYSYSWTDVSGGTFAKLNDDKSLSFELKGATPNPFNPTTTIAYAIPEVSNVTLTVYDISGREVARLVDGYRDAGAHEVTFDASELTSGVYLYRLNASDFNATGKMALIK